MGICSYSSIDYKNERKGLWKKVLLLGSGYTGKSTLFQQLKFLFDIDDDMVDGNLKALRRHIQRQIIHQMHYIMKWLHENDITENSMNCNKLQDAIRMIENLESLDIFSLHIANTLDAIEYIWKNDERLKNIFHPTHPISMTRNKYLHETTEYFLNNIDRIKCIDFVPNETDIICIPKLSFSIHVREVIINNDLKVQIFDIGGTLNERRKWIQVFNTVNTLIYIVSLSSYNEMMVENLNKNRMVDSLELFGRICQYDRYFRNTKIILLLNKMDVFEEKIKYIPVTKCPIFTENDFKQFVDKYKSIIFKLCQYYCYDNNISLDILNVILIFCGFGLNVYHLDDSKFNQHQHNNIHLTIDPHHYDATRYYIKYKFESMNKDKNKIIHTYFINITDKEDVQSFLNYIISIMEGSHC